MLLAAAVAGIASAGNAISPRSGVHAPEVCCDKPGTWSFETSSVVDSGRTVFTVRMKSPTPATPPEFDVFFTESGADVHNVWVPFYGESERNRLYCVEWGSVRYTSELGQNYPIACAFNEAGESVLAVAASECLRLVRYGVTCHSTDALLEGRFRFFSRPEAPRTDYEVKILVDRRRGVFFGDAIAAATRWIEQTAGLRPCRVPEAAFDPLYSSWYAFWQDVHDQELEEEARKAAALGMKTMILDDGWQKESSKSYYSATGDWMPVASRFPDFRSHVDKVHAAGLKYMLWLSVPFVGNESKAFKRFEGKFLPGDGDVRVLDPRFPEVRQYLVDTYVRCVRDWDFDGLKLDFIDSIVLDGADPAEKDGWAGRDVRTVPEAVDRLMKEVYAALTSVKPDVLIEFRQKYTGPAIRQYGNMLRATDCPCDLVGNRRRIADLRLASGGTAVHSDMLVWSRDDTPEDAARSVLNAIFGVVQYSMRLATIPPWQKEAIRHWIAFSQAHRETLLKGKFRPYSPELMYPLIEAEGEGERIFAVYSPGQSVKLPADKTAYVLNATKAGEIVLRMGKPPKSVEVFDTFGERMGTPPCGFSAGEAALALPVPASGYARIEW